MLLYPHSLLDCIIAMTGWLHLISWFKSILPLWCCNRAQKSTNDFCSSHPNFYGKFNFYPFYNIMSIKFPYCMEQQLWALNTSVFRIVSWKMSDLHQTSILNQIKGKFQFTSPTFWVWMRTSVLIEKQRHNFQLCARTSMTGISWEYFPEQVVKGWEEGYLLYESK